MSGNTASEDVSNFSGTANTKFLRLGTFALCESGWNWNGAELAHSDVLVAVAVQQVEGFNISRLRCTIFVKERHC